MAFCANCGASLSESARFCAQCGCSTDAVAASPTPAPAPGPAQAPDGGAAAVPRPREPSPPAWPSTGQAGGLVPGAPGLPPNVASALCYLFWLVSGVLFLVLEPYDRDPQVRFHAFQSIFFSIATILISAVVGMLPLIGWLLWYPVWLALLVVWVMLLIQAFSGKRWKLPVIGDWAERQAGGAPVSS